MAAGKEFNATDYIQHHLTFFRTPVGEGDFWALNVDTVVTSILLGILGLGLIWWVVRGATSGVPNKRQAFVELLIEFVDNQVKGLFQHGDRNKFIAPTALTVFVWVTLMNAMDWLPADVVSGALALLGFPEWRPVPTADINATFALSISVLLLSIYFAIAAKGLGGWIHELFCAPLVRTRCYGRQTSCSTWWSTSRRRSRTPCGYSATSTRARFSSFCCGCGLRPAWWERSSASCSAWAGRSSTSSSCSCRPTSS
jgi:F0F1-type ATP synthase membrane subunit a